MSTHVDFSSLLTIKIKLKSTYTAVALKKNLYQLNGNVMT